MPQTQSQSTGAARKTRSDGASTALLLAALMPVLVEDGGEFSFAGAITRRDLQNVWTWCRRDLAPDLLGDEFPAVDQDRALEALLPKVVSRARTAMAEVGPGTDAGRRLRVQLGGPESFDRLPAVLDAMRCLPLLRRAVSFGRAVSGMEDDEAVVAALQSMPRHDASVNALLMMAAMGQLTQPGRLVAAAVRIAGSATEAALLKGGFGPLIDAIFARAQDALPPMAQLGAFADVDLKCQAVERFHRLMRAINSHVELARAGKWAPAVASFTRAASIRLEPQLRDLVQQMNRALGPGEGIDRLDSDGLLAALNGFYLLASVRDCRDSLALNEILDDIWSRSGPALEQHLARNMEANRLFPNDQIVAGRLEAGIKMAQLRFGAEYADILRVAYDAHKRRAASG